MVIIDLDRVCDDWRDHADELGISSARLRSYDEGRTSAITLYTIDQFCKRYRCRPGDFIRYIED